MLEASVGHLRSQLTEKQEEADDAHAEASWWEQSHADLTSASTTFQCHWGREEMDLWGQPSHPYPWEIVRLAMRMCQHEAPCSQLPQYIRLALGAFFPELQHMPLPSPETCRTWRLGLLVLNDLVSALKIVRSKTLTLHHDGSSKGYLKLGIAVCDTDNGPVMPSLD